jgi:hypothetical protein
MSAPTTRRGLLGASATLAAIGFAGPAQAIAGTLSPAADAAHPDAALIALCAQFEATEARMRGLYDGPNAVSDDEAELTVPRLDEVLCGLLPRLNVSQAKTPAGVHAGARLLAAHNGHGDFSWEDPDTMAGMLLGHVIRDAAAVAVVGTETSVANSPALPSPDDVLIAKCAESVALEAEWRRLEKLCDVAPAARENLPDETVDALEDAIDRKKELADEIAEVQARTPAGIRAKAEAVGAFHANTAGTETTAELDYPIQRMMWSLVEDAAGRRT